MNRMKPILKRAGLTQRQLARELRCSPEWISRIATGNAVFSETTQMRIVHTVNKHLDTPLTDSEIRQMFGFPGPDYRGKQDTHDGHHLHIVR